MHRKKRVGPTSIRLSPEMTAYVETLNRNTGWSLSRTIENLVSLAKSTLAENPASVKKLQHMIRVAVASHARIMKADETAKQARNDMRKAAAAAKEQP